MVNHLSLLSRGEPGWEWYPFCFSWNPEKLGQVVGIHSNRATVDSGVKIFVSVVLYKYVGVEDPDLLILDGSLKIEVWEPPASTHLLVHLYSM